MRRRPVPLPRVEADAEEPLVLAVDASGPVECLGLAQGDLVLATHTRRRPRGTGSALAAGIHGMLQGVGREAADLDGVVAVTGPGSFTGLRVGIATAQGLAAGLRIPTLSSSATRAWALGCIGTIGVVLDARRGEVFAALYETAPDGSCEEVVEVAMAPPADALARFSAQLGPLILVGDGARLYRDEATRVLGDRFVLGPAVAPAIGRVAIEGARRLTLEPDARDLLRPVYLRDHDAALNRA